MRELTKESLGIIDQFLNFTISGDIGLHTVSLKNIMERIEKKFQGNLRESEGTFKFDLQENHVLTDEILLEQVISNIVSNSIKYSAFPERKLIINISSHLDEKKVTIVIEDNGIGLHEDELPHLFEKGWRSPSSAKLEGKGIGLYTVKNVVENMRGILKCESVKNSYTKVIIILPKPENN